jgi:hypothetical protein
MAQKLRVEYPVMKGKYANIKNFNEGVKAAFPLDELS